MGDAGWAPWRAVGIVASVALVLVEVSGGKAYYAIFMAAGALLVDRGLARGRVRLKAASFAAAAVSGTLIALLMLRRRGSQERTCSR